MMKIAIMNPGGKGVFLLSLALALFLGGGCAHLSPPGPAERFDRPAACGDFLDKLDAHIEGEGVRDLSSFPLPGFPYLRTNRFLTALGERLEGAEKKAAWSDWLHSLADEALTKEIAALSDAGVVLLSAVAGPAGREVLLDRAKECTAEVKNHEEARRGTMRLSSNHSPGPRSTRRFFGPSASIPSLPFPSPF